MNIFEIDDLLEAMVLEDRRHFAPHYICARIGVTDVDRVADYLLSLSGRKVIPIFDIECPNGDRDFSIADPGQLDYKPRYCQICGEEYSPDPEHIWLAFNFTKEYIDHVKKKKAPLNQIYHQKCSQMHASV